jgi:nitrous oxidase accessory protein NosD
MDSVDLAAARHSSRLEVVLVNSTALEIMDNRAMGNRITDNKITDNKITDNKIMGSRITGLLQFRGKKLQARNHQFD